ncbi:hypothetical protein [Streptococcus uberis]|uniref:hypothetical protein n=1 Tax=Streptococcus uberis TaxID=1349 RepID=UPI003891BD7A
MNYFEILSKIGFGSIIGATFVYMQNLRKNQLEYVTDERSKWRQILKNALVDLLDNNNIEHAINTIKSQLNPYGRLNIKKNTSEYYLKDGHIWDLLENFNYSNSEIKKLVLYIELSLKYDWEKSKKEVIVNYNNIILGFINLCSIILCLIMLYFGLSAKEGFSSIHFMIIIAITILLFQGTITDRYIKFKDKYRELLLGLLIWLIYLIPTIVVLICIKGFADTYLPTKSKLIMDYSVIFYTFATMFSAYQYYFRNFTLEYLKNLEKIIKEKK